MSYSDQHRRTRPTSLAAVTIVHLAIGYAFISGLAYRVIGRPEVVTTTSIIPDTAPPPPAHALPPPPTARTMQPPPQVDPIVIVPLDLTRSVEATSLPQIPTRDLTTIAPPPPPPHASLAREAAPAGGRGAWVTPDDYPAAALRAGASGVVGIAVLIGTDGRVAGCQVMASSGNPELDDTTCRTYARRARFSPALDAEGKPIATHRADRIRWQLPE